MVTTPAPQHDLAIDQGATFAVAFVLKDAASVPIDLTDYVVAIRIKFGYGGAYVFDSSLPAFGDSVVVTPEIGRIDWTIDESVTATFKPSTHYNYDVFIKHIPTGEVDKMLWGYITVVQSISFGALP